MRPGENATLNLPAREASAGLLATVIDKGFFARRRDAVPLLPRSTLDDLFVVPAVARIRAGRSRIHCAQTARELILDGKRKRISKVVTRSGRRFESTGLLLPEGDQVQDGGHDGGGLHHLYKL